MSYSIRIKRSAARDLQRLQPDIRRRLVAAIDRLADDAVQVVHITSPNRVHFDQASRAMKAGKHVLIEKPLSMTSEEIW